MSDNDRHLSWATEEDFRKVQRCCLDGISKVSWLNNVTYEANVTLAEAAALIKNGFDGGEEGIRQLIPLTSEFSDWMDLLFLVTFAYNREQNPQLCTIIRKEF